MREFRKSYRLYGPVTISDTGEIQGAKLRGRSQSQNDIGVLDFYLETDTEEDARSEVESKYQRIAQDTSNILSYVVEEDLNDNPQLRRALTWYSLGLSTQTPEDQLVAFWTGMESLVENKPVLTQEEEDAYNELTDTIDEELSELDDLRERVRSILGNVQNESNKVAVKRVLVDKAGYEESDLDDISILNNARGSIVHNGEQVEDADEKANTAKNYLRDLLDSELTENIDEIVDFELPLEFEDRNGTTYQPRYPTTAPEDWLGEVFEHEPGLVLTKDEIFKRSYPIFKDIHKVARIGIVLPEMCGWGKPLREVNDDIVGSEKYRYSPLPDWVTPQVDSIMRYLYNSGELPVNVITRNANNVRSDVNLNDDETQEVCLSLEDR